MSVVTQLPFELGGAAGKVTFALYALYYLYLMIIRSHTSTQKVVSACFASGGVYSSNAQGRFARIVSNP